MDESQQNGTEPVGNLNQLIQKKLVIEGGSRLKVELIAPSYISYAHYQNQSLVSLRHGVQAAAHIFEPAENGDYTLRVTLRCQGRDISEPSFLTLSNALTGEMTPISYKLDGDFLFEVREATPATFVFSILDGVDEIAFGEIDSEVFPPNLWSSANQGGLGNAGLLLSTFVRPRDPSLDDLLTKARQTKGTYADANGRPYGPNTSGYQGDDAEVFAEVKALYEAVQSSGIHYSNPPGSEDWTIGQLVRTNDEILKAKAATCLDSTILFASLLENVGIKPILALIPGHAFVGFWTTSGKNYSFSGPVAPAEEAIALMSRDVPLLHFVETTKMCVSQHQLPFERAVSLAADTLMGSLSRVENAAREISNYVQSGYSLDESDVAALVRKQVENWRLVDVSSARQAGYRPLAAKITNADGSSTVMEYTVEQAAVNFNIQVDIAKVGLSQDSSPARVKYWKSQLLDLTFNNPLLNMSRRSSQIKFFVPKGRLGDIEDFLQQNKGELKLQPGIVYDGERYVSPMIRQDGATPPELEGSLDNLFVSNQALVYEGPRKWSHDQQALEKLATNKIRNLSKSSKTSIDETGLNNLYMTFGSLRWKRKEANGVAGDYTVSPLILLPVVLRPIDRGRLWAVALDDSNDVATNETLALKLYQDWGISIPALTAPAEDDAGLDIPGLIQAVQIAVDEAKQSTWIVQQDASIGTYDFSTFHMWKDLNDNWEKLSQSTLVKHLIETDGTYAYQDPMSQAEDVSEEELDKELALVPVPTDGTQLRAVVRSLRGESFIIQGPPGTGKSQTITNLLARNLQEGKKVLFMSEKPAALQVVKDRLDEIRLGNFVLDLHSKNTSAESIRGQLIAAMDANPRVDKVGIETEMFDFDVATKALSKYPERLHRINEVHGQSVYSIRDTLLKLKPTEPLKLNRASLNHFHGEALLRFKSNMVDLDLVGQDAGTSASNPWSFSSIHTGITVEMRSTIGPIVRQVVENFGPLRQNSNALAALDQINSLDGLREISQLPDSLPSRDDLALLSQLESKQKLGMHLELLKLLEQKLSLGQTANERFGAIPIADLEAEFKVAQDAKLFKKKKLETLAAKLKDYWAGSVTPENLATSLQQARELFDLGKRVAESSFGIPGLGLVESTMLFSQGLAKARIDSAELLSRVANAFSESASGLKLVLELPSDQRASLISLSKSLVKLFEVLESDANSFELWLSGKGLGTRLSEVIEAFDVAWQDGQFTALSRWGSLLNLVFELKTADQLDGYNQILSGQISFEDAPWAFERARLSLLLEKLIDEHELLNFSSGTQNANISKLKRSVEALRIYNRDTIASSVVKARTFDPTAVAGRAGALRSEINKQKGKLSVRQLMKKYWETITEITPCVAASPDSVARFLDVNLAHFDLVVFDEASQLRVATSIGALGRGKAAVIVGDSKQMPPTSFFAAGASEEEQDEEAELAQPDVESILTMAEYSKLPSVRLKWHYRSQDESLIAFSNRHYYENDLASFPSPAKKTGAERAVVFMPVEGAEYIRGKRKATIAQSPDVDEDAVDEEVASQTSNTNLKEAQEVVKHILALHKEHGASLNLGVVTMNESQRKKISDLLETAADEELKKLLDSKQTKDYLFVRALEKVQGDERDIIIMSIGFATVPDPKSENGRKLPLTFGPLIKAGSEKRLNVAVTRARKKVFVFCSFDPTDMKLSDTSSEGMKGLKEYLTFAKDETGESNLGNVSTFEEPDRHRIDVAKHIESLGYKVVQNFGLSNFKVDVAVEHPERPGEFLLAILLDGPGWKSRPAANDRDVLPVGVLEKNMGWKAVERIWMPVWIKDPEGEKERIRRLLQDLVIEPVKTEIPEQVRLEDLPDLSELITGAIEQPTTGGFTQVKGAVGVNIDDVDGFAFVPEQLVTSDKSHLQHTSHPEIQRVINELIGRLTTFEGPVHPDRAVSFIAKCFGLSHVQSTRASEILAVIPRARFTRDDEGFIFPDGLSVTTYTSWKRKNKGEPRDILMISLTELGNAMRDLCDRTHGMEEEELLRQTMLAFGPKTLSAPLRKRLEAALKFAVGRKQLVLDGEHYIPGLK